MTTNPNATVEPMTDEQRAAYTNLIGSIKQVMMLPEAAQLVIRQDFNKFMKIAEENMPLAEEKIQLLLQYNKSIQQGDDCISMYKHCVNKKFGLNMATFACDKINQFHPNHIALHESKKKFEANVLSDLRDFLQTHIDAKDEQTYQMFAAVTTFKEYFTTREEIAVGNITINNRAFFANMCEYIDDYEYCISMDEAQYNETVHELERQVEEVKNKRETIFE